MSQSARAVLCAAVLAVSCAGSGGNGAAPIAKPDPGQAAQGRGLYDRYCALCHGAGAKGYAADNASQLANPTFLATASDEFLRIAIERGRPKTPMSAFGAEYGGPLERTDTDRIVAYLRSLSDAPPAAVEDVRIEGDPERGRPVFRERCARCHGDAGQGKNAISLSNPTFAASASAGFVRYAIEHGRPGTRMPAFGSTLSDQQIDDLTALIFELGQTSAPGGPAAGAGALPPLSTIVQNPGAPPADFELREGRFVAAQSVLAALRARSRIVVLDARPLPDWHRGHIPGAYPTPFYADLDAIAAALPKDGTWIVAYCACPHAASGKVVDALRERGFARTAVLDEGIIVWEQLGYPIERTAAEPAR